MAVIAFHNVPLTPTSHQKLSPEADTFGIGMGACTFPCILYVTSGFFHHLHYLLQFPVQFHL